MSNLPEDQYFILKVNNDACGVPIRVSWESPLESRVQEMYSEAGIRGSTLYPLRGIDIRFLRKHDQTAYFEVSIPQPDSSEILKAEIEATDQGAVQFRYSIPLIVQNSTEKDAEDIVAKVQDHMETKSALGFLGGFLELPDRSTDYSVELKRGREKRERDRLRYLRFNDGYPDPFF